MWMELKKRLAADLARVIEERFGVESRAGAGGAPAARAGRPLLPGRHAARPGAQAQSAGDRRGAGRGPRGVRTMVRDIQIQGAGFLNFFLDRRAFAAAAAGRLAARRRRPRRQGGHRAHQHQSQQGGPHRPPAQRRARRRARPLAARAWATRSRSRTTSTTPACSSPTWWSASSTCAASPLADVAAIPEPFDFYCWDLYSEVGRWFEEDPERQRAPPRDPPRDGDRPRASAPRWARLVARRVVSPPPRHHAADRRLLRPAHPRERHPGARTSSSRPSAG